MEVHLFHIKVFKLAEYANIYTRQDTLSRCKYSSLQFCTKFSKKNSRRTSLEAEYLSLSAICMEFP